MKKLMIAIMVVGSAICANAAAVDWSATWVDSPWTGKTSEGWLGYMLTDSAYSTVKSDLLNGNTASLLANAVGPEKTVTNKGAINTGVPQDNVAGGYQTMWMVVLNAKKAADATYFYANSVDWTIDSSLPTTVVFGKQTLTPDVKNWTAMAPEPTSGLLLLIGMGALALRRRRA